MGYANQIEWHPDGGYSFVDQSGSYASFSYEDTRQALIDSGRQKPDELLLHARKNWLRFTAVQTVNGPTFAIEQNGEWSLSSDYELYDLLIRDGFKPAEAKAFMAQSQANALDLPALARLVVKCTL